MGDRRPSREERFTQLFDAHYSAVHAYVWRRDPNGADDIVAEAFTIAWQRLDSVPDQPLPWLIGVARNVRFNLQRGERRRQARERYSAQVEATPSSIEVLEAHSALIDALGRLSAQDREVLLLAAWEKLDRASLAAVLDCSKSAVAVRLFRARRRLAATLAAVEKQGEQAPIVSHDARGGLLDEN